MKVIVVRKAAHLLLMIANLAVDLLLPTVVLVALTPTHLPTSLLLSIGGMLLAAKAMGGPLHTGFRWRLAILVAVIPMAGMLGAYAAGLDVRLSMVVGAVLAGVIVIGDLVRNGKNRLDAFALMVLAEVVAGVVLTSISGDARFVLARMSIYLAIGGVVVLATTWTERPFMRTMLKPVAAQGNPKRADAFDRCWENSRKFRGLYRAMTAGLGLVFLVDAVLRIVIIYSRPADAVVESSLTSQLPLVVLIIVWFAAGRGLAVPRAERILDAELHKPSDAAVPTVTAA
jgi:intracellular septation protein A